jgi:hypothetical protein
MDWQLPIGIYAVVFGLTLEQLHLLPPDNKRTAAGTPKK